MWTDIKKYVKNCAKCQVTKWDNRKPAGKLQQVTTSRPNEMWGVDIMGPMPKSGKQNEYLLVFVDYFSKWVELFPMRHATAQTIATILRQEMLTRWGVPDFILSDRGAQFVSSLFTELCGKWNITPKLTTAYHPQTNMTERVNRTLKSMIAGFVEDNHKTWDTYLPELRFALNSAIQESIGMTPAELHLGRKIHSPMDKLLHRRDLSPTKPAYDMVHKITQLQRQAKENYTKAQKRQLRSYDKNRRDVFFRERERVWVRNFPISSAQHHFSAKLAPKWKGPYRIIQQLGPVNYQVSLEDTGEDVRNVHVCNLKPCFPTAEELEAREKNCTKILPQQDKKRF
nr:Zgc:162621 protein [Danio rerio]